MFKIGIDVEIQKQGEDSTYFDPIQLEIFEDLYDDKLILKFGDNSYRLNRNDFLKILNFFNYK